MIFYNLKNIDDCICFYNCLQIMPFLKYLFWFYVGNLNYKLYTVFLEKLVKSFIVVKLNNNNDTNNNINYSYSFKMLIQPPPQPNSEVFFLYTIIYYWII